MLLEDRIKETLSELEDVMYSSLENTGEEGETTYEARLFFSTSKFCLEILRAIDIEKITLLEVDIFKRDAENMYKSLVRLIEDDFANLEHLKISEIRKAQLKDRYIDRLIELKRLIDETLGILEAIRLRNKAAAKK